MEERSPEAINDQHIGISNVLFRRLCIAHHLLILNQCKDEFQVVLPDDMRRDNEFPVLVSVEVSEEYLLVRLPRRTSHKDFLTVGSISSNEFLHQWQLSAGFSDLQNPVETCVPHHHGIVNTYLVQKLLTHFVLYKEACKTLQHTSVAPSVPSERTRAGRKILDTL